MFILMVWDKARWYDFYLTFVVQSDVLFYVAKLLEFQMYTARALIFTTFVQ
jgi:hypothetical protein